MTWSCLSLCVPVSPVTKDRTLLIPAQDHCLQASPVGSMLEPANPTAGQSCQCGCNPKPDSPERDVAQDHGSALCLLCFFGRGGQARAQKQSSLHPKFSFSSYFFWFFFRKTCFFSWLHAGGGLCRNAEGSLLWSHAWLSPASLQRHPKSWLTGALQRLEYLWKSSAEQAMWRGDARTLSFSSEFCSLTSFLALGTECPHLWSGSGEVTAGCHQLSCFPLPQLS